MSESLQLIKFAGLLRSGLSMDKALATIGGMPKEDDLRYLISVAQHVGSAVCHEIDLVAEVYSFRERAKARIQVVSSGPKASTRLVIWLPLITLALAQLVGIDVLGSLTSSPLLLISLASGSMLLLLAKFLSRRMIGKAEPKASRDGIYLLGVALATSGGALLNQAQIHALDIYKEIYSAIPSSDELKAMAEISLLVTETGARVSDLLRRQADLMQRNFLTKAEMGIEKLSVKLLLPLGLVVLPAFVLVTVVPLMVSMLGSR